MGKKAVRIILCIAFLVVLAGAAGIYLGDLWKKTGIRADTNTSYSSEVIPEFIFTYAENQAEDYPTTQGAYHFAKLVEEKTGGRIRILVQADGVLGDEKSVAEQLQFGGVDFMRMSLSPLAEFVPKLNVLQLPYLYRDADHMWAVLQGEIGDSLMDSLDGSGMVALSWYDAGTRNFYNSVRSVTSPEDMKGLNIRVQESEMMTEMVKALGANPIPMPFSEVYSGLQTGNIDGAENNWPSYESASHFEVAGYVTIDEHNRVPELQLVSQLTWNQMSLEDREIIKECALESALYERQLWAEREKISEEKVRQAGCEIVELSAEEKARFQEAVSPMYEKFCGNYMDIVEAIIAEGK